MIADMLTYRRPHDSIGEREFIERFILPANPAPIAAPNGTVHAYALTIPNADGTAPTVAFCAHTDSVHNRTLPEARQSIGYDPHLSQYFVNAIGQRDCLGADDAAGCYVLLKMIAASTPGLYVFFRGEERGGIGSSWVAEHRADLFANIRAAIQFDRKGRRSIITHMAVGRTCSDAFADSLAGALRLGHERDDTGSFTDTANLATLVPECCNVSCGYEHEHSASETLDALYLEALTEACIAAFATTPELTIAREPGDFDIAPVRHWSTRAANEPVYSLRELIEMNDDDIEEVAKWEDYETVADLLRNARDALRLLY